MSVGVSRSDRQDKANLATLQRIRVSGGVSARFAGQDGQTRIQDLVETGGYRLLLPNSHGAHAEAVQINTGGGIVGGDCLRFSVFADHNANVTYATQSAERIYRATELPATIDVSLEVAANASLSWLPQEAILYSGARVRRTFTADIDRASRLLLVETIVFGRIASGEQMGPGYLRDTWRVRRNTELVFADTIRLDGDIGPILKRPAVADGARGSSLILYFAPDAEERLAAVREVIDTGFSDSGASAWNGMLVIRMLAADPAKLKADLRRVLRLLHQSDLPRVWST